MLLSIDFWGAFDVVLLPIILFLLAPPFSYLYMKKKDKKSVALKELTCETNRPSKKGNIEYELKYKGQLVEGIVVRSVIWVYNNGKKDLEGECLSKPLHFRCNNEYEILDVKSTSNIDGMEIFCEHGKNDITVKWNLLKCGDGFRLEIYSWYYGGKKPEIIINEFFDSMQISVFGKDIDKTIKKESAMSKVLELERLDKRFRTYELIVFFLFVAFSASELLIHTTKFPISYNIEMADSKSHCDGVFLRLEDDDIMFFNDTVVYRGPVEELGEKVQIYGCKVDSAYLKSYAKFNKVVVIVHKLSIWLFIVLMVICFVSIYIHLKPSDVGKGNKK